MNYELRRQTEQIGALAVEIETLKDLDRAIDDLCEDPKAFEDLCPYFGVLWPSARALSRHLERMGTWLKGKTVLEVGCGLALPSIVAAKLGAKVTATDFHPDVPAFLARNLKHNGVEVEFKAMDWRAPDAAAKLGKFDFIVGSDIAYEKNQAKPLAETLSSLCHKESHIVLADPGRPYFQALVDAIETHKFRSDLMITKDIFVVSFANK